MIFPRGVLRGPGVDAGIAFLVDERARRIVVWQW
jgi:hypothetical protein